MNPLDRLIKALSRLPGIGEKTATRLALFILREKKGIAAELVQALSYVREKVKFCRICENLTEEELCLICKDARRNPKLVCVVQEPVDLLMVEKTGEFHGCYHILHGVLSPLDGVGPEELRIGSLIKRAQSGGIDEIILAMNPNSEGETTALYLKKLLSDLSVKVTRIASGMPVGGILEYTDPHTLSKALDNRREF